MRTVCRRFRGFTLIEVLVVVAVLLLIAVLFLPALARSKARSSKINCVNNLKQIGLSFRTWALDNKDMNPYQVSVTNGGTLELIGRTDAFMHFAVMSNELSTPKILICPDEKSGQRVTATTFNSVVAPGSPMIPFCGNSNLSYFASVDATEQFPQTLLSGDRQLGLDGIQLRPGLNAIWTNSPLEWVNSPHGKVGNIGFADGSVQQVSNAKLLQANQSSGIATNRLDIP